MIRNSFVSDYLPRAQFPKTIWYIRMKKPKAKNPATDVNDVDFDDFRIQRKEIMVNGKKLPLKIGDRVRMCENDTMGRTVMGITIHEDSRIQYILEWHDPSSGSFSSEALTLSELKLLTQNAFKTKKGPAGFSEGKDD